MTDLYKCDKCDTEMHKSHLPQTTCNDCLSNVVVCKVCNVRIPSSRLYIGLCEEHMKCLECGESAITYINGICNTCTSKKDDTDNINWPKHYNASKIQPIDFIESIGVDFRLANVIKYVSRAGKKDPKKLKEDLLKAKWYLERYIEKECSDDKK